MPEWAPKYETWRHGGWYVTNVSYPSGAVGCVSRNYPDGKWRIVCDTRSPKPTYPSRDAAARAEKELAELKAQEAAIAARIRFRLDWNRSMFVVEGESKEARELLLTAFAGVREVNGRVEFAPVCLGMIVVEFLRRGERVEIGEGQDPARVTLGDFGTGHKYEFGIYRATDSTVPVRERLRDELYSAIQLASNLAREKRATMRVCSECIGQVLGEVEPSGKWRWFADQRKFPFPEAYRSRLEASHAA